MTDTNTSTEEETSQEAAVTVSAVSGNPSLVEWPRDQWGMTVDLRKALIESARSVRGNDEKLELFMATVKIGVQHALARLESDKATIQSQIEAEEAAIARRNATGRVAGYTPLVSD